MVPAAEFLAPPTSFISVSLTTEVRALHRVVSQRQVRFLCCGGDPGVAKTAQGGCRSNRGGHHGSYSQNRWRHLLWFSAVLWSVR
jgi:hypothetical protein